MTQQALTLIIILYLSLSPSLVESYPRVTFLYGPEDVYVQPGEDTYFNCTYNGTQDFPSIVINGYYWITSNLPARHRFEFMRILVTNVQLRDNNSWYQCTFPGVASTIGHIIIPTTQSENATGTGMESSPTTTQYVSTKTTDRFESSSIVVTTPTATSEIGNQTIGNQANQLATTTAGSTVCSNCNESTGIIVGVLGVLAFLSSTLAVLLAIILCCKCLCVQEIHTATNTWNVVSNKSDFSRQIEKDIEKDAFSGPIKLEKDG